MFIYLFDSNFTLFFTLSLNELTKEMQSLRSGLQEVQKVGEHL